MKNPDNPSAEVVMRRLDEQHSKYKFMEANLEHKKKRWAWLGKLIIKLIYFCILDTLYFIDSVYKFRR